MHQTAEIFYREANLTFDPSMPAGNIVTFFPQKNVY